MILNETTKTAGYLVLLVSALVPVRGLCEEGHKATVEDPTKPRPGEQLGHSEWVNPVAYSPYGRYALSGSNDKTMKLCDISTGPEISLVVRDFFI